MIIQPMFSHVNAYLRSCDGTFWLMLDDARICRLGYDPLTQCVIVSMWPQEVKIPIRLINKLTEYGKNAKETRREVKEGS